MKKILTIMISFHSACMMVQEPVQEENGIEERSLKTNRWIQNRRNEPDIGMLNSYMGRNVCGLDGSTRFDSGLSMTYLGIGTRKNVPQRNDKK